MDNVIVLIDECHGINIPKKFVTDFDLSWWDMTQCDNNSTAICNNPDHPDYWEAWQDILDNATFIGCDGRVYHLYQDGTLLAICYDAVDAALGE